MTISDVSKMFNISQDTLRYYEKMELFAKIHRDSNGVRNYSEFDLNNLKFIRSMKNDGFSIRVIQKYVRLLKDSKNTIDERQAILVKQQELLNIELEKIQEAINILDDKILNSQK